MLTEEQIKNLKPGDSLIIRGTFERTFPDRGAICIKFPMSLRGFVDDDHYYYAHPSAVSIDKYRYDPCRKFKKKDRVRVVQCNERFFHDAGKYLFGAYCEVADDEEDDELIRVFHNSSEYHLDPAYLELITPAEELGPYYISKTDIEFQVRMGYEDKDCLISCFRFENIVAGYKQYHDMLPSVKQARERAEAECERLNAEYIKEHNND